MLNSYFFILICSIIEKITFLRSTKEKKSNFANPLPQKANDPKMPTAQSNHENLRPTIPLFTFSAFFYLTPISRGRVWKPFQAWFVEGLDPSLQNFLTPRAQTPPTK